MAPLGELCEDEKEKLDEVRSALARGEDVNDKNAFGATALMFAVGRKHNSIVKLLLDQPGVKINEKDNSGSTALHSVARDNNPQVARMLLLHPAMDSANLKDKSGETAVMKAVKYGIWNMKNGICGHKEDLSELVKHESVSLDIGNVFGRSDDVR